MRAPAGPDPDAYFGRLHQAHAEAEARCGAVTTNLAIAGHHVAIRYAGPALVEAYGRAFSHLVDDQPDTEPELTIHVFDSASTGVPPPPAAWGPEHVRERGLVAGLVDDRFHTVFQVVIGQLSMLDRLGGSAVCWMRSAHEVPVSEQAAPLWRLLHAWLAERQLLLVHAAAVGLADGGALVVGPGGAGKSSSTLACVPSRLGIAGDDYVVLDVGDELRVHSIYSVAKVHPSNLERMPFLRPMLSSDAHTPEGKSVLHLHEVAPLSVSKGFPLRAVLAPAVREIETARLAPISRGEVMRALAPSSVLLAPHTAVRVMPALVDLVHRLPVFQLEVGSDASSIPTVMTDLIESLGSEGSER